jgi:Tol biopolymer transport system component
MPDRHDVLDRFAPLYPAPEPPPLEALYRRRERKQRNQRVAGGVVGLLIFLAATWFVTSGGPFDSGETPAVTGPTPVPTPTQTPARDAPRPVWTYPSFSLNVAVVQVGTGRVTSLPSSIPGGADYFQASRDGERLAFHDGGTVYVADVDGSDVRAIAEGTTPAWSPDGTRIVYQRDADLFVVDVASGRSARIFRGGDLVFHPNFSADGGHVLFTWREPGTDELGLWTVPIDGGPARPVQIAHGPWFPAFGTYSPDGTTIAYRRTQFFGETGGSSSAIPLAEGRLWLADADGSHRRAAAPVGTGWMSLIDPRSLWPMWSPDGTRVAYEVLYGKGIYVFDVTNGSRTWIGEGTNPSWLDDDTLIIEDWR